jgi:hypothetical protein
MLETVRIEAHDVPGGFMLINRSDFDPAKHKLFGERTAGGSLRRVRARAMAILQASASSGGDSADSGSSEGGSESSEGAAGGDGDGAASAAEDDSAGS